MPSLLLNEIPDWLDNIIALPKGIVLICMKDFLFFGGGVFVGVFVLVDCLGVFFQFKAIMAS